MGVIFAPISVLLFMKEKIATIILNVLYTASIAPSSVRFMNIKIVISMKMF